jgi:hypothetical protein
MRATPWVVFPKKSPSGVRAAEINHGFPSTVISQVQRFEKSTLNNSGGAAKLRERDLRREFAEKGNEIYAKASA